MASVGGCDDSALAAMALLDSSSSALAPVLDAVAAQSCEVIRAGLAEFDCPDTGDGTANKDRINVASNLKDLLLGSKFVASGRDVRPAVADIPDLHGSFRCAVRLVHKRAREGLNSMARMKPKELLTTISPLVVSIEAVGEITVQRCKLIVGAMDNELQSQVHELFENQCANVEARIQSLSAEVFVTKCNDIAGQLHETYIALGHLRTLLAWEAALALFSLELSDADVCNKETQVAAGMNGEGANSDGKKNNSNNNKKKKRKVLGRGTAYIRAFFKEKLDGLSTGEAAVLIDWAAKLSAIFDPVGEGQDSFVRMVEEFLRSNEARRLPKIPKGTRDFAYDKMTVRERAFGIIINVFKRHGAMALDTPTFELRETLMGKYGEDSKLIYDLADQGGEICALRYDLTVPFARYLAMNKINTFKRYHIAKVFRRDNPSKGRYREFCQCDFDIAGKCHVMEFDFEVLKVLTELLDELNIGDYEIKLNHRKLLDEMLAICGVPASKFRTVCSSIDKLDKLSFEEVKDELVKKGLLDVTAEKIGAFVRKRGRPLEILSELKQAGSQFLEKEGSVEALKELGLLFAALEEAECIDKVVFDLSLARGLDYYTGVIFEAVFKGDTQVGSIGAGGRYDNLVKQFGAQSDVPAVGASLGIERVLNIMEEQLNKGEAQKVRDSETQVLVVAVGKNSDALLRPAVKLANELWKSNLKAEFAITHRPLKQIDRAIQNGIPFMVFVGEEELSKGTVKLKEIEVKDEQEVPRDQIVAELQRRTNRTSESIRHVVV